MEVEVQTQYLWECQIRDYFWKCKRRFVCRRSPKAGTEILGGLQGKEWKFQAPWVQGHLICRIATYLWSHTDYIYFQLAYPEFSNLSYLRVIYNYFPARAGWFLCDVFSVVFFLPLLRCSRSITCGSLSCGFLASRDHKVDGAARWARRNNERI